MQQTEKPRILVAGCGMIGSSMAAMLSGNGYHVSVLERDAQAVREGRKRIEAVFGPILERGLITEEQIKASCNRVEMLQSIAQAKDSEIAFECVGEVLEFKQSLYQKIFQNCPKVRAVASTSSAFLPDHLANGTDCPEKILVSHPINPPHLVPFVEIVPHKGTDKEAVELVYRVLTACGRKPVVMEKTAPGFIANRLQHALLREAFYMVEQGYTTFDGIDQTLKYSIMPRYTSVGLFEHQDAAGLDLVRNIEAYLFPYLCSDVTLPKALDARVESGNLGIKTGEGIYRWSPQEKERFFTDTAKPYWTMFDWPNLV